MKLSALGASLTANDLCRDPSWTQRLGMLNRARDGFGPYSVQAVPAYSNGYTPLSRIIADAPDIVLIGGDLIINSAITGTDHGVLEPYADQQADASNLHLQLSTILPVVKEVYVSIIPPPAWSFGGNSYITANTTWAQLDAYCKTLWPLNVTIDYADIVATLGTIDGIHQAFGANTFMACSVAWQLQALGIDMGLQLADYAPYDGSGGIASILANIRARNVSGLAIIQSLNLKLI